MANAQLGRGFVHLDQQARFLAAAAQMGLRAAQRDQRRLDRFDLDPDRLGDFHQQVERLLVGDGEQGVLMSRVEWLDAAGQGLASGPQRQVAEAAFFELGEFAANIFGRAR